MQITEKYYENEVREGFFVSSKIKRAWAAELEVLGEIDRICRKHNIMYFAEWGTLLGAVRHNGFIPWDDDLDIGMKRADYEKFLEVAKDELPSGYKINNYKTHDDFWLFLARVINSEKMCFEDTYLKEHHEFPYIAGVDIFLIDYVSKDEEKENRRDLLARYVLNVADNIAEQKVNLKEAEEEIKKIEDIGNTKIPYNRDELYGWLERKDESLNPRIIQFRKYMYGYVEKLFAKFSDAEADELTQLFPFGMTNKNYRYPKEYYEDFIRLPFETTTIPVPIGYDAMLKRRYGDYMKIHKKWNGHDYPFFETQLKSLNALTNLRLPSYEYTESEMHYSKGEYIKNQGYKSEIEKLTQELELITIRQSVEDLQQAQEIAITIGNMIEAAYGEGLNSVKCLEEYCEQLYVIFTNNEGFEQLSDILNAFKETVRTEVFDKTESIFIVSYADKWCYIEEEYKARVAAGDNVKVITVPYYYKRFDGSLIDRHYEYESICDAVCGTDNSAQIVEHDQYDIEFSHPDKAYIQEPYDEWDSGISLDKSYYTQQLVKNCGELIYISPFDVDSFPKDAYCEYYNMGSYVTVPGVVRADRVYVNSEEVKESYIDKLVQWSGENTRTIWENKILVKPTTILNKDLPEIPEKWQEKLYDSNGNRKKIMLYHMEVSFIIQNKEKAMDKLSKALDTFEENQDRVLCIFNVNEELHRYISDKMNGILESFNKNVERIKNIGIYDESDGCLTAKLCDAFYGDPCYLMRVCQIDKKPIMIEEIY